MASWFASTPAEVKTSETKTVIVERPPLSPSVVDLSPGPTPRPRFREGSRGRPPGARPSRPRSAAGGMGMSLPPVIQTTPTLSHVFRFRVVSAVSSLAVHVGDIMGIFGNMTTIVNSQVVSFASTFKLRQIVAWPPQNAGSDLVFINWSASATSGFVKDDQRVMTLPDGITVTGSLTSRPNPKSLASNWISNGVTSSAVLFYVTAPAGAIIDLHAAFTMVNSLNNLAVTVATATPLGAVYYLALDGPSSNKIQPFGLPSTH